MNHDWSDPQPWWLRPLREAGYDLRNLPPEMRERIASALGRAGIRLPKPGEPMPSTEPDRRGWGRSDPRAGMGPRTAWGFRAHGRESNFLEEQS